MVSFNFLAPCFLGQFIERVDPLNGSHKSFTNYNKEKELQQRKVLVSLCLKTIIYYLKNNNYKKGKGLAKSPKHLHIYLSICFFFSFLNT